MAIFYLFSIFVVIGLITEMGAFGKGMANQNHIFGSFPLNSLLLGAVIGFTITFTTFFPFIGLNLDILYFVIVFVMKEVLSGFFIAARSEDGLVKEDLKELGIVFGGGILLTLFNHYVLVRYTNATFATSQGDFNTGMILVAVISDIINVSNNLTLAGPLAFISGILIYAIVTTQVIMLSKSITYFEYIFSFVLASLFVLLLSAGNDFASSLGTGLGVFAFYLATQVILKSRRRFAVFFALTFIASGSIDPSVFVGYAALAIVTTIVYTFLRKSKVYLFGVQLVAPIAVIGSLLVYEYSAVGAVFMVIITVFAYIFMLTYVKTQVHATLNKGFLKSRIVLPLFIVSVTVLVGLVFIIRDQPQISDLFIFRNGMFDNIYGGHTGNVLGVVFSSLVVLFLMAYQWYGKIKKKKMIEHRLIVLLSLSLILFAYNPFFEISFIKNGSLIGISALRNITIIPIVIALSNKLKSITGTKVLEMDTLESYVQNGDH